MRQQYAFRSFLCTWFENLSRTDYISVCITCTQPLQSLAAQLYTVTHVIEKLSSLENLDPARLIQINCPRQMSWKDLYGDAMPTEVVRDEFRRVLAKLELR
eukprot:c21667_g1_i3.p2 GENE.c21667_g1_i3~~c21667_g1_i3.p2  ORF type:complete len:101 (-),score=28.79 c21667_g1_i3:264-566(-)